MGQNATWKETCIKFVKYVERSFEQTFMKFSDSSDVWCLGLYLIIYEIYKGREMHRHYVQADTFVYLLLLKI